MKIYTEINYEWIDGGLVEISSDSFDYEGEVDLCWSFPRVDIAYPVTIITENLSDAGEFGNEGLSTGMETISENMTLGGDTQAALQSGTSQIQTGLNTTVGQAGNYLGEKVVEPVGQAINTGLSFIGYLGNRLSEFLYGSSKPSDVEIKNEKTAGGKNKQSAAEMDTNKAAKRSRSSLKITA
jgi:hypothetical protein